MNTKRYAGMAVAGLALSIVFAVPALIAWSIVGIRSLVERGDEAVSGVR